MTTNVSYIRMASTGSDGKPDVSIPLVPTAEEHQHHPFHRPQSDHVLMRVLAVACAIMAVIIVGLSLTVGYALVTDSNQRGTIQEQQVTINHLSDRVDQLETQIRTLEQRK